MYYVRIDYVCSMLCLQSEPSSRNSKTGYIIYILSCGFLQKFFQKVLFHPERFPKNRPNYRCNDNNTNNNNSL